MDNDMSWHLWWYFNGKNFEKDVLIFWAELSALENLEELDLSRNHFNGSLLPQGNTQTVRVVNSHSDICTYSICIHIYIYISSTTSQHGFEIFTDPLSFSRFRKLKQLDLSHNHFGKEIFRYLNHLLLHLYPWSLISWEDNFLAMVGISIHFCCLPLFLV